MSFLTHLNFSGCEITKFDDDVFRSMPNVKVLDISFNKLGRLSSNMFVSLSKLEKLFLVGNFEAITFESYSFSGLKLVQLELLYLHIHRISQNAFASLNLTELNIFRSRVDILEINSFGELYVENVYLNTTQINDFHETIFHGARGIKLLKTDRFKFCCVRPAYLPLDSCFPGPNDLSSCGDLISNEVLRPLIWIIGLVAVVSNVSTVSFRILRQREQLKRASGILVTSLSFSDCIMGLYLLIIAGADSYFRDIYVYNDEYWRNGAACKFAGILSSVSYESSMFFVGFITLDRFLLVKYPLRKPVFEVKNTCILVAVVWCLSLLLAILPLVLYPVFEGKFYSQSGVCLALPITRTRPPGHTYAVAVFFGLNSVGYAFIALGQWYIYTEMKAMSKTFAGSRSISSRDARVATRLLLVAVTEMMAWLPIFVLGEIIYSF